MTDLLHAAAQRAAHVRTRADRPSQRRGAQTGWSNRTSARRSTIELRAQGDTGSGLLHFVGHANTYEQPYEMYDEYGPYVEVITAGAGARSLLTPNLDVPLVLDHDSLRRIASTLNGTLTLAEEPVGLLVDAPALNPADHDVAYIAPKMQPGPNGEPSLITEMSFRFRIIRGIWSPDYTEYRIEEYDIHRGDVAIVGYGANPNTDGALRAESVARQPVRGADVIPERWTLTRSA